MIRISVTLVLRVSYGVKLDKLLKAARPEASTAKI